MRKLVSLGFAAVKIAKLLGISFSISQLFYIGIVLRANEFLYIPT